MSDNRESYDDYDMPCVSLCYYYNRYTITENPIFDPTSGVGQAVFVATNVINFQDNL